LNAPLSSEGYAFVVSSGFAQLGEALFLQQLKKSTQKKSRHSSLAFGFPPVDMIYRASLIRHPCLKQAFRAHPVRSLRKITPPLSSSEGELGASREFVLAGKFDLTPLIPCLALLNAA